MRTISAAALIFLAGCGKEPPAPAPPPTGSAVAQDDTVRIRGFWVAAGLRREEGKPEETPSDYTLQLENGNYTMQLGTDFNESGRYLLVPGASPKQIDITTGEGEVRRGIYTLEGDKLTICMPDQPGAPRPTEFKANADDNRTSVVTFTRTR